MSDLEARLAEVRDRIEAACAHARRRPGAVSLVAVTKTVPAGTIARARAAGHDLFGENRVQEALPKIASLPGARWHLVGHLQRNKARHAVGAFETIHSVDDVALAAELDRRARAAGSVQPVLLEVNVAGESTKHGVDEQGLPALAEAVAGLPGLDLRGLMTIPPPGEDPEHARPWFARLRVLRDDLEGRLGRKLPELSMGMSDDYEVAIEEGATLVRIGRAIFGHRPSA